MDNNDILKKVISHSKANGFIYQSSEIYDGLSAVYDYGPYGSELKNNLKEFWWKSMTQMNDNICLLYTSPSPRDGLLSRMPSSA